MSGRDRRTTKTLTLPKEYSAYQKAWFQQIQVRVRDDGEPFAVMNADAPHEIFRTFGIPYVVNQWWASICAAKQKSGEYLELLRQRGYPDDQERYSSMAFASSLADQRDAPWGGLPTPTILVSHTTGDSHAKIFELWAREHGATFYPLELTIGNDAYPYYTEKVRYRWEELIGRHRIDQFVEELKGLIRFLEIQTGRTFSMSRFRRVMELANEQNEWNARTRDLIARTRPAPVSVADNIPSVMIPQWHRGTEWGRVAARRLYETVADRVARGERAAAGEERARLMWVGRGLWFNMGFYQYFEQKHGAVFVWSMYLAVGSDAYIRYGDDPLRALAGRFAAFPELINMPPWSSEWYVREARRNQIDGVVHLRGDALRGAWFITQALEREGIPVVEIQGDNVDDRGWSDDAVTAQVEEFLEQRVIPRLGRRGQHPPASA